MLLLLGIILFLKGAFGSHHWVVTESGRIEPKLDSAFPVHRPYDLFSVIEQDQRVAAVTQMHNKLVNFKNSVDDQWSAIELETEFEKRLYATDPNCKYSGDPLSRYHTDPVFVDFPVSNRPHSAEDITPPDCRKFHKLDFSLLTYPHLKTLREHENMTVLTDYMESDAPLDIDVLSMLRKNHSDWTAYNLAVYYWQLKGNYSNAIQCARRAIFFAPRDHRHLPLLNLGTLLHSMGSLGDAAIVLHASVDLDRSQYTSHMALGHVYSQLADYTRAAGCYENALSLRSNLVYLAKHRAAILCQQALIDGLWAIDAALKKMVEELQEYSKLQERWVMAQTQIGLERACGSTPVPSPDNLRSLWKAVEHQALLLSERITQTSPLAYVGHFDSSTTPDEAAGPKKEDIDQEPPPSRPTKQHSPRKQLTFKQKVSEFQSFMITITANSLMPPLKMKEKIIEKLVSLVGNYDGNEPKSSPYWQILDRCRQMLEEEVLPNECGQQIFAEYVKINEKVFPGAEDMMDESIIENYVHDSHQEL